MYGAAAALTPPSSAAGTAHTTRASRRTTAVAASVSRVRASARFHAACTKAEASVSASAAPLMTPRGRGGPRSTAGALRGAGFRGRSQLDGHAAAPRVARTGDVAGRRVAADRLHPAEEDVARAEAHELVAHRIELLDRHAGLDVEVAGLDVQARRLDRGARVEAVVDRADDRLQQRRADPVRPRGAEHELDLAVVEHDGRRH